MDPKNKKRPIKIFYIIFILLGLSMAIDPLIPVIAENLGIGYDKIGIALLIGSIAVLISTFIAGRLSDRFDIKKIIILGLFLLIAGFLIFGIYLNYFVFIIVLIMIRGGFGAIDTSTHTYFSRFTRNNTSNFFVFLDIFWFLGAFLAPLVISASLFLDIDPKFVFLSLSIITAILLIFLYRQCPPIKPESAAPGWNIDSKIIKGKTFFSVLKDPVVLLCSLALFFYLGGMFGFTSWLTTYFLAFQIPVFLGSAYLSVYWLFSVLGLLLINRLIKSIKEINILLLGCSIGFLCLIFF